MFLKQREKKQDRNRYFLNDQKIVQPTKRDEERKKRKENLDR